jgi:hypothetical protein
MDWIRTGVVSVAAVLITSCGLLPSSRAPSAAATDSRPPETATPAPDWSLTPIDTPGATLATARPSHSALPSPVAASAKPTAAPEIDLGSIPWLEWLASADYETYSLYVGRLDGRVFSVHESGQPPRESSVARAGPLKGSAVTTWVDADEMTSIDLIDTSTGATAAIATGESLEAGVIDPSGTSVYWATWRDRAAELWRRAVDGGPAERVLAGRDAGTPVFSLDGEYVVIAHWNGQPGDMESSYDYTVFDDQFEPINRWHGEIYGPPIGFLGDRLVVFPRTSDDIPPTFPLFALDIHDWSSEEVAVLDGESSAAIAPAADGSPRLVVDALDEQGRYSVSVLEPDGSMRVIFTDQEHAPFREPPNAMLFPFRSGFGAPPGWVAVFPQGRAMTAAALNGGDQGPRRLVRMSDGYVVDVPPLSLTL